MASVKSRISQLGFSNDQAAFNDDDDFVDNDDDYCDDHDDDYDNDNYYDGDDGVEENDDILGVICDVDAFSLRWRSPENCHDMFES